MSLKTTLLALIIGIRGIFCILPVILPDIISISGGI